MLNIQCSILKGSERCSEYGRHEAGEVFEQALAGGALPPVGEEDFVAEGEVFVDDVF